MSMEQELMEEKKVFQFSTDLVLKNLQKRIDGLDKEISFFNLVSPSSMLKKKSHLIFHQMMYLKLLILVLSIMLSLYILASYLMKRHKKNVNIYMR